MFFLLVALFVGSFILSSVFAPKPKIENARASALSDFNFPRANEGSPVPRIYGTVKTKGPNAIYTGDFEAKPVTKKVKTGLFSSKKQIVGYNYKIGLDLAVALGPCVIFRRMFFGTHEVWNGCLTDCASHQVTINLPDLFGGADQNGGVGGKVSFYPGNFNQGQNAYLVSKLGANVPAYVGVAHVVFEHFWFGNSTNIEPVSFEVQHFSNSLGFVGSSYNIMSNGLDANPVEVLYDLYVNNWGNLNVNAALLDVASWKTCAITVYNENNGMSVEIGNPQQGKDISTEILRQINALIYEDPTTGLIKMKLIRADYDITTLPTMGPAQIKSVTNFTKKLWEETFNRVRVKYQDRDRAYMDDAVAIADDFANIRFQGRQLPTELAFPGVKTAALANALAARELSNLNVPLFQAELQANRTSTTLRPGDVFKLSWPEYNIVSMVVRIRKFGLGTKEDGTTSIVVVQDQFSVDATVYGTPVSVGSTYGSQASADITASKVFELPYFLANAAGFTIASGYTRLASFAVKPGGASIDYFFMLDDGSGTDTEALSHAPYSSSAAIVPAVNLADGFANGLIGSLKINNVSNPAILANRTAANVRSGFNLFYVGNEILGYETFVNNGDGTYTLTNVHRALLDTPFEAHSAGAAIFFFDGQEGFVEDNTAVAPVSAYLLDRSITGRSTKAGATINALVPVGRPSLPVPPDLVNLDGSRSLPALKGAGGAVAVTWTERNRTTATIAFEDDAANAAEAGTTYDILLTRQDTGATVASALGVASGYSFAIPATTKTYDGFFNVYAKVAGARSFTPSVFPVTVLGDDARITENGDEFRYTEAEEVRLIEG